MLHSAACFIQSGPQSCGEFFSIADTPVMQKENARLLMHHVIMYGDYLYTIFYKCFNNRMHLIFQHCKIPCNSSFFICALPCCPSVKSRKAAYWYAVFLQ